MRGRFASLRARLIATYLAVVTAVVVTGFVTVDLLTPVLFQERLMARIGPGGRGSGAGPPTSGTSVSTATIEAAYEEALRTALFVSALVGLAVAVLLAIWLSKRLLNRLADMGEATRRLASGDYGHPLVEPEEVELADLARSINKLDADLAATEQSRARLVSDLAHELRNPLATIEGYMEGLIDGLIPADNDTYSKVADEAHRLQRLTADLSLLSKAQENALDLVIADCDLAEVAAGVAERLGAQFLGEEVKLVTDLEKALPVAADADRLTQAITNIVGNALTHTPPGGTVTITGSTEGSGALLEIRDTGVGIPPDQLEAVFRRFTRLDPQGQGTGIGLNIARTIVRLHGGELVAESGGKDAGTTFVLTMPMAGEGIAQV